LTAGNEAAAAQSRRLDQWLWFTRLAKSRSLAARLCAAGEISVNGTAVRKANHAVRPGDVVLLPQGKMRRAVRVVGLGTRRGPATEARLLYEEAAPPTCRTPTLADWEPLLGDEP
jgi:ribosome-associated heat shock protein Hsp15